MYYSSWDPSLARRAPKRRMFGRFVGHRSGEFAASAYDYQPDVFVINATGVQPRSSSTVL